MKPQRFSQRIGKKSVRESLQVNDMDDILCDRLWNHILIDIFRQLEMGSKYGHNALEIAYENIWTDFLQRRLDQIPLDTYGDISDEGIVSEIRRWYFKAQWYEKYDFIEFLLTVNKYLELSEKVNQILKDELAGYTVIQNQIVPITSEQEILAIEEALTNTSKYQSVDTHLCRALELLSDRQSPDYRNSIKESISAVEAYCAILTNDPKATLGKALKQIEDSHKIHPALKTSMSGLYGYTSDSGGIRHSLLEDDIQVTFEDAKFMLVSCSAFINYLKAKEL